MFNLPVFLGSACYVGFLPKAPGTWASLATLPLVYILALYAGPWGVAGLIILSSLLTFYATPEFERLYGRDPAPLVTDETAGQSLTFLFITFSGAAGDFMLILTGFLLFRFFDIIKPLGIKYLQHINGGQGVLYDDLVSGIYAYLCLELLILFFF